VSQIDSNVCRRNFDKGKWGGKKKTIDEEGTGIVENSAMLHNAHDARKLARGRGGCRGRRQGKEKRDRDHRQRENRPTQGKKGGEANTTNRHLQPAKGTRHDLRETLRTGGVVRQNKKVQQGTPYGH